MGGAAERSPTLAVYAWLALNAEFFILRYDNTQRKSDRADKQGYSVLQ